MQYQSGGYSMTMARNNALNLLLACYYDTLNIPAFPECWVSDLNESHQILDCKVEEHVQWAC